MRVIQRLRRHPMARPMAVLLQVALAVSALFYGAPRAQAQDIEAKLAVVLDFGNLAVSTPMAGDEAAAALTLALVQRGYEVTPRAEVQDRLKVIGVRPPFEPDEVRLIKQELDIRDLFTGSVVTVNEVIGARSSVEVLLRIEQYDGETGDLVNGAYGKGFEILNSGDIADREAGRASATERAIAQALDKMAGYTTMIAAVMSFSPPNRVLINKGRKQGVQAGMEFNVFRTKADPENPNKSLTVKVGRVRVTESSNDDAIAAPVESTNQGINTRDELREVFRLPDLSSAQAARAEAPTANKPPAPERTGSKRWFAPIVGTLVGVAGIVGLVMLAGQSTNDAPSTKTSGVYLRQSAPGVNPSVEVTWGDRNFAPPARYIGGYVIYRGTSNAFAALESEAVGAVPGSNQRRFTDDPTYNDVNAQIPLRYERLTQDGVEVVEQILDVRIIHESPQPGRTYFYKVRRLGPPAPATPPTVFQRRAADAAGAGSAAAAQGDQLAARASRLRAQAKGKVLRTGGNIIVHALGLPQVTRQVTNIPPGAGFDTTLTPATDNDIPIDAEVGLSDASGSMGPVTYLVPPDLLAPSNNNMAQRVDDIGFQWQGVLGATEYVVQISTDAIFRNIAFTSAPIATTATGQLNYRYNVAAAGYQQLSPNAQYFWRVGAKSTFGGQRAPEPDGYVFSSVYTFQTADQPPTPPRR